MNFGIKANILIRGFKFTSVLPPSWIRQSAANTADECRFWFPLIIFLRLFCPLFESYACIQLGQTDPYRERDRKIGHFDMTIKECLQFLKEIRAISFYHYYCRRRRCFCPYTSGWCVCVCASTAMIYAPLPTFQVTRSTLYTFIMRCTCRRYYFARLLDMMRLPLKCSSCRHRFHGQEQPAFYLCPFRNHKLQILFFHPSSVCVVLYVFLFWRRTSQRTIRERRRR